MCMYIYIYMYVYIYINTHVYIYIYIHMTSTICQLLPTQMNQAPQTKPKAASGPDLILS